VNQRSISRTDTQARALLRGRLAAVRRDHILDAATRVFAAKGFPNATIREIARLAGVADGTIYLYFRNKAALLLAILDRLNETEQRREHLAASQGADPAEFVRGYLHHRFDVFGQVGFDAFRVLVAELLVNPELRDQYRRRTLEPTFGAAESAVRGWLAGDAPGAPDAALVTRALAGMVLGVLLLRLLDDRLLAERWDDVPDALAGVFLHGLTSDPAHGAEQHA
jgi:AcrR family transcriptional regulator